MCCLWRLTPNMTDRRSVMPGFADWLTTGYSFVVIGHESIPQSIAAAAKISILICYVVRHISWQRSVTTNFHHYMIDQHSIQKNIYLHLWICILHHVLVAFLLAVCCTGERLCHIENTADSNNASDNKPLNDVQNDCSDVYKSTHMKVTYSCTLCEKTFLSRCGRRCHMNIHAGKYKCSVCVKCFGSSHDLAVHRRSHSGEKLFECTVCSKRFSTSCELVVHSRIHSGEKPYKCSLCNKSFTQSGHLQTHKRCVHSNSRPYECPFCRKLLKTNIELKLHVRIHSDAKPYSCRHCSGRFTRPDQLKTHLLKSHNEGTWFTCNICQKKFTCKNHLKKHLFRHEGVKPYVCSECPKCFYTAGELTHHQPVHSDYKQFCCGLCGKDFKHKPDVKIHFRKCSDKHGLNYVQLFVWVMLYLLSECCCVSWTRCWADKTGLNNFTT